VPANDPRGLISAHSTLLLSQIGGQNASLSRADRGETERVTAVDCQDQCQTDCIDVASSERDALAKKATGLKDAVAQAGGQLAELQVEQEGKVLFQSVMWEG
jgi:hypothetical protein